VTLAASASIRGTVIDAHGAPAFDCTVIVFPDDESKWNAASGLVRTTTPYFEGDYELTGIVPGTYWVIAYEVLRDRPWDRREFLRKARDSAQTIDLRPGETELHLKVDEM
jgi:hypothetical protein